MLRAMKRRSTIDAFFENAHRLEARIALRHKVDGAWRETSWGDYARLVRRAARAFVHLGVAAGGAVIIVGPNRPEWVIADLGAMAAGAVPAPIYPTLTGDQAAWVAAHCEATVAVVHDAAQLAKLRAEQARLPRLTRFVLMEGQGDGDAVLSWDRFLALGDQVPDAELDQRIAGIESSGLATLIYTSGTTGTPKAVMITHGNLLFIGESNRTSGLAVSESDHLLSYLPLSHIAEQVLTIHVPAVNGCTVSFCEKLEQLGDLLRDVRPTVFFGVPRVWEKLQAKMVEAGASAPWLKRKIAKWARSVGLAAGYAQQSGKSPPLAYGLAKRLVFSKVRERLGLDRARLCASGAASISKATLEFFLSLDIPIYEVYGMSESTGPATINLPGAFRLTTVGRVLSGTELKLAEDGEILMRGPHVFVGYLKDPVATGEALDADGWLHSGDIGEIDADGFVRITDRKNDLFKTAGGKFIAPQKLEALLKSIPGVGQAVAIGNARRFVAALVTLDPEAAAREAERIGSTGRTVEQLAEDRAFLALLDEGVKRVNHALAPYESVKRIKVLATEFTIDSGELTPTLKIKRKVVGQRWAKEIEALYE